MMVVRDAIARAPFPLRLPRRRTLWITHCGAVLVRDTSCSLAAPLSTLYNGLGSLVREWYRMHDSQYDGPYSRPCR